MSADGRYVFPDDLRRAYERLLFPMAVYQFTGGKVVTLLVSDGMCDFMEADRDTLVNHYDENMFGNVHPDDREALASLGARFAVKEGPYDIVYRDRLRDHAEYRYVHTVGKYHTMDDGSRVAFLMYADISASAENLVEAFHEITSPQARFLDESTSAMIIVSSADRRMLYCNKAAKRMLPPQVIADSYLTFQEYFYHDIPGGIPGLFDIVGAGAHEVIEPRTGRRLEADVTVSEWDGEQAYVIRLFELGLSDRRDADEEESRTIDLHRRRAAFNSVMFSGEGNDLKFYQRGYRGFRVWNLTEDRMVSSSGSDFLRERYGENLGYDQYLVHVAGAARSGGKELLRDYRREALLLSFESGMQPPEVTVELDSQEGLAAIRSRFSLMRSPDGGDLYVRVAEENVTDRTVTERLTEAIVSREFDFACYVDGESGTCRMVFGQDDDAHHRAFTVLLGDYCETLASLVGRRFSTVEGLERYIEESCRDADDHTETFELGDGSIKSVHLSILDRVHRTYYIRRSDITELIGDERKRERDLSAAMLQASKANEAAARFLSSMSHDMRTPLNGIMGFSRLALETQDAVKRQDYLEKINQSSVLMLDLVNDVLDLSKMDSSKLELHPVDIDAHELIDGTIDTIRELAVEKGVEFRVDIDRELLGVVHTDPLRIQQVLLNLLTNAVKYTPRGGTVDLRVMRGENGEDRRSCRIVVSDTGIGMSPEFLPRVFEPFSQENRKEARGIQGTGLGLDIVKRVVDLMGGTISVQSALDGGSTFTVLMPIEVTDAVKTERTSTYDAPPVDLDGRRILVCEDNYLNAEIVDTMLRERGVEVVDASDGAEALGEFESSEPGFFDMVLMDVRMPTMDGLEATRRIRALDRADAKMVPIIAMSADAFTEDVEKCLAAGMNDHVSKPIDPRDFFAAIEKHL